MQFIISLCIACTFFLEKKNSNCLPLRYAYSNIIFGHLLPPRSPDFNYYQRVVLKCEVYVNRDAVVKFFSAL